MSALDTRAEERVEDLALLLLAPSHGFGGGIERMADSVAAAWAGPVARVDLYRSGEVAVPKGHFRAKLHFVRRATLAAIRQRPAVVITLHVNCLPVALPLGRLLGARVVTFGLGVEVWDRFPWWKRRLIDRTGRLLAISSFTAYWMARRARVDIRRIRVVYLPVDRRFVEQSCQKPRRLGVDAERPCLLTVSRLVPEHRFKGCFDIVEALPLVLARRPNVRWIVVGQGADLPVLRARCESLGVAHAVEFTGGIGDDQLVEAYRRADIFVLPSQADPEAAPPIGEGFGLVFAEAGAFGLPSIGSSAGGGALEFVVNEETGLTVPPNDPQALAGAILRLVDEPSLRARLGQAAEDLVASRHHPSQFSEALWDACAGKTLSGGERLGRR